jgi:hypothetical protein
VLQSFGAGEAAIALVFGQLVHLMQLLEHALLVGLRQAVEAGVVTQRPLLILNGLAAVLVKPVAQVTWRN